MSPPSFDPRTPSPARRYDHWLGGKDNFGADRNSADQIRQKFPDIPVAAKENRLFVLRAVTYLAQAGVRQFLDIGFGLPEPPNVHEVAQEVAPDSRVVYVDNDVEVVTHARGRMTSAPDGAIGVMHADLRTPVEILADPAVRDTLDLTEPVAVLLCAVLHFLPDTDRPHETSPLQWPEGVGHPALAHRRPSCGSWRGGSGSCSSGRGSRGALAVLLAATVWGTGVCYMWPTMLASSNERFPRGGALLLGLMGTAGNLSIYFVLPQMGAIFDRTTSWPAATKA